MTAVREGMAPGPVRIKTKPELLITSLLTAKDAPTLARESKIETRAARFVHSIHVGVLGREA